MERSAISMLMVLFIVGLVIGVPVGYFMAPVREVEVPIYEKEGVFEYSPSDDYPVEPIYSESVPYNLEDVQMYRIEVGEEDYLIFVWYSDGRVYWSYAGIGG